jgi:hypothetical protein
MSQPIRRIAALAASAALSTITMLGIWSGSAQAATSTANAADDLDTVELHRFEPGAPQPGDVVTVAGTVTNVSDQPLENVQALFRYDSRPIQFRSEIAAVGHDPRLYWGWRPGHIFDTVIDVLEPGQSASFAMEMTINTTCGAADPDPDAAPCLAIPAAGVFAIGVDVNATPIGSRRLTAGTARTVLPWQISSENPIDVAMLWPVTAAPSVGNDTDDLRATLGPDGWLHAVVARVEPKN